MLYKTLHYIKQYYFWTFLCIAIAIYVLQHLAIDLSYFIKNHLNDLLCLPIVLKVCQSVIQYVKSDDTIYLTFLQIFMVCLGYSIFFEWYLPSYHPRYTADYIDVLLYNIGGVVFYGIENYNRLYLTISTNIS